MAEEKVPCTSPDELHAGLTVGISAEVVSGHKYPSAAMGCLGKEGEVVTVLAGGKFARVKVGSKVHVINIKDLLVPPSEKRSSTPPPPAPVAVKRPRSPEGDKEREGVKKGEPIVVEEKEEVKVEAEKAAEVEVEQRESPPEVAPSAPPAAETEKDAFPLEAVEKLVREWNDLVDKGTADMIASVKADLEEYGVSVDNDKGRWTSSDGTHSGPIRPARKLSRRTSAQPSPPPPSSSRRNARLPTSEIEDLLQYRQDCRADKRYNDADQVQNLLRDYGIATHDAQLKWTSDDGRSGVYSKGRKGMPVRAPPFRPVSTLPPSPAEQGRSRGGSRGEPRGPRSHSDSKGSSRRLERELLRVLHDLKLERYASQMERHGVLTVADAMRVPLGDLERIGMRRRDVHDLRTTLSQPRR
eukprot:Sspe_Gene.64619::Locus_38285_Transcript_1_1_Confidence_1.000_Length_1466::g.64619::m.64619